MRPTTDLWTVGPEDDELLLDRLGNSLQSLGYELDGSWNGIARSREVFHWEVSRASSTLVIESETGAGLTVFGTPSELSLLKVHFHSGATLSLPDGDRLLTDFEDC